MWHLAYLLWYCSGCFCILNQYLSKSRNSGAMTTPVHTSSVCSLTGRQTEGPASLGRPDVPMQTQRWDVCHAEPVFAWLSTESPAGCPVPRASLLGKEPGVERRLHMHWRWRRDHKCLVCRQGQKGTHLTQPRPVEKDLFYSSAGLLMRGDSFGLAGGHTECQSCHGGGWPYQPSIDTGRRRISLYRTHTQQGLESACWDLFLTCVAAFLSAAEYFHQFCMGVAPVQSENPPDLHLSNLNN